MSNAKEYSILIQFNGYEFDDSLVTSEYASGTLRSVKALARKILKANGGGYALIIDDDDMILDRIEVNWDGYIE